MRISIVHSFYSSAQVSGENVVVNRQARALERAGHQVHLVERRTDELEVQTGYRARVSLATATGIGPSPVPELRRFGPDVVHVHNLFPNFGTRWCNSWDGPLVATLHNFRTICAAGTLLRDGKECTLCPAGSSMWAVRHRCYRGSIAATVPLAIASRRPPGDHPLIRRADRLIALAPSVAQTYESLGVPGSKIAVLPNFVSGGATPDRTKHAGWLLAGRLSPEKGTVELLRNWPPDIDLDVVGSGPDEARARGVAPASVTFHGSVPSDTLREMMLDHIGLVFPSMWREHSPLVYLEALEAGLPVLALAGSWPAEDVVEESVGVAIAALAPAQIRSAVERIAQDRGVLSRRCRSSYERRFSEASWVTRLLGIYREAGTPADLG